MSANDVKIKQLLSSIEDKRKKLGTKPKMSLQTNGLLKCDEGKVININTINSQDECVRIVADIVTIRDSYIKAADLLGINASEETKYYGFSIKEWLADFKLKVDIIKWTDEDKKIKALEQKLKSLRSEDLKTADALGEIEDLLKDLDLDN